jgi:predicted dehydrogenase
MAKKITLGAVGCGLASGKLHGTGYRQLDEIELVGFTDRERNYEAKTVPLAKEFGVKAYHHIDEMPEDGSIEAVDVCKGAGALRDRKKGTARRKARALRESVHR